MPGLGRVPAFDTWLLVGNTTATEVEAQVKVTYTVGGLTRTATLPVLRLGAYQVQRLELNDAVAQVVRLPRQIDSAGVEITHTGAPGAVVAHGVSVDRTANMCFDVLLKDPDALPTNRFAFPWRLTGQTRSLVQIKNPRSEVGRLQLKLVHEAGE